MPSGIPDPGIPSDRLILTECVNTGVSSLSERLEQARHGEATARHNKRRLLPKWHLVVHNSHKFTISFTTVKCYPHLASLHFTTEPL